MEKAKAAVSDFMGKAGHHDTTVHESVAPAVTHQTVKPEKHEKITTAIDKEVHQDHYHTSVQPVHDRETLPEKHHHNLVGVEHRQFDHGKDHDVAARLEREAAQFKDTTETATARETRSVAPQVGGEHIHHHVHETIQPVVNKETIQPHVVHTTVPIHEVHHNAATHHSTSALPAVSMADFKKQGGSLSGREERYDGFEGEPRAIGGAGGALGGSHSITGDRGVGTSAHHGHHDRHTGEGVGSGLTGSHSGSGLTGSNTHRTGEALGTGVTGGSHPHDRTGERGVGGTHFDRANEGTTGTGSGLTGTGNTHQGTAGKAANLAGGAVGSHSAGTHSPGTHGTHNTGTHSPGTHGTGTHATGTHDEATKPSLLQRLNPLADTDGDGKKGFMD